MMDDATHGREFGSIEQQALEHVWIHSARWLDLAERDGLRVMVRGADCSAGERGTSPVAASASGSSLLMVLVGSADLGIRPRRGRAAEDRARNCGSGGLHAYRHAHRRG